MIEIIKKRGVYDDTPRLKKVAVTKYEFRGHAEDTDVCNGFSTLICAFCVCLRKEKPDLKYVFERREESIRYEDGIETDYEGKDQDYSVITYSGWSRFEEFFDIATESMRENFPGSFVNKG